MTAVFETFGGLEDVEERRGCTLINFTLVKEITAF